MIKTLYLDRTAVRFHTHFAEFKMNNVFSCVSRKQIEELQRAKMLRGNLTAAQQLSLLSSHDDLQQALEGAFFVQVWFMVSPLNGDDFLLTQNCNWETEDKHLPDLYGTKVSHVRRRKCIISHLIVKSLYKSHGTKRLICGFTSETV